MSRTKTGGQETISLEMDRMWRPVFDSLDLDRDGRIRLDHFATLLNAGNAHLNEIPQDVLDYILERADWDKDHYLTYEEFLGMIRNREIAGLHPRLHRLVRFATTAVVPRKERLSRVNNYVDQFSCFPPPVFMLLISVIEISVYVYYCVDMREFSTSGPVPFSSPLIYNPRRRYEGWRYLTYALIHAGFLHMFFNVLVQLFLGVPLEMVHKGWRVAIVYFAGIISGSLAASIADPSSFLAGASGGVYALISAHLANVVINFKEMEYAIWRLLALILFATSDIVTAVCDRYSMKQNKISYAAHLSGAVAGFLVGVIVLRNLRIRRWETIFGWFAAIFYLMLVAAAVIFNVLDEKYFEPADYTSLSDSIRMHFS